MKIHVVTDEGKLIDTIEKIEQYRLNNPSVRDDLVDEIDRLVKRGRKIDRKIKIRSVTPVSLSKPTGSG